MSTTRPNDDFDDELLSAYVDNELTAAERAAVEERLHTDERARQVVAELRAASDAVKSLPREKLGRDLAGSVLAELQRRRPAEEPAVLTLPQVAEDHRAGRNRGLAWAGLGLAAALLLMVLRPGDEVRQQGQVARSSADKKLEADPAAQPAAESKIESRGRDELSDLSRSNAEPRSVAEPTSGVARGGGDLAGGRADFDRELAERDRAQTKGPAATPALPPPAAAASEPMAGEAASRPSEAETLSAATATLQKADNESIVSNLGDIETIEVTMADDQAVSQFESALAATGITIVAEAPPADALPAGALAVDGSLEALGRFEDAAKPAEAQAEPLRRELLESADAYLVEATPAQIAAVTAALRQDEGKLLVEQGRQLDARSGVADDASGFGARGAFGGGAGGFGGGGGRGGESLSGRAWRLSSLAKESISDAVDAPASEGSEAVAVREPERRGGRGGRAGAAGAQQAEEPARVLFILRRPEAAAAPAAAQP